MASNNNWTITLEKITDIDRLESVWTDLESRAHCSFFQSWAWIGNWLYCLPVDIDIYLIRVCYNDKTVGLAALRNQSLRRHKIIQSRALMVGQTGEPVHDAITIEHNGFLMQRGLEPQIIQRCYEFLINSSIAWDELMISGLDAKLASKYLSKAKAIGLKPRITIEAPYFFVDLESIRTSGKDYLSNVSRNTRYQIRRALREYERMGPIVFRAATTVEEALYYFYRLRTLHQEYWNAKGHPGAFATPFSNDFHERVITYGFPRRQIQLIEVSAGRKQFGYIYNFVLNDVVSNYQTGFDYGDNPKLKPGIVSHYLSIQHNLAQGMQLYDFLMGDRQYKRSLATNDESMIWLTVQKNRLKFAIESFLETAWHRLHN